MINSAGFCIYYSKMRRFAHGFCNSISHSHRYNLYRSFRRNREVGQTLCLAHNWVHDCGRGYFYHIAVCHNEGATMQSIETHPEIRLFCDLDHTLIYSHRVPIALNKIVVEEKKVVHHMNVGYLSMIKAKVDVRID